MTSTDPLATFHETGLFTWQGLVEVPAMLEAHDTIRMWLKRPTHGAFTFDAPPDTYSYVLAEHTGLMVGLVVTEIDADPDKDVPNYRELWYSTRAQAPNLSTYRLDEAISTRIALSTSPTHGRSWAFERLAEEANRTYEGLHISAAPPVSPITPCANCGQGAYVVPIDALPIDSPFSRKPFATNAHLLHHVDPAFPDHPSICGTKAEAIVYHLTPETTREDLVCKNCDEKADIIALEQPEITVNEFGSAAPVKMYGPPRTITYHVKSGSPYCYGKLATPQA